MTNRYNLDGCWWGVGGWGAYGGGRALSNGCCCYFLPFYSKPSSSCTKLFLSPKIPKVLRLTVKLASILLRLYLSKLRMGLLPGSFLCWISIFLFYFFYGGERTPSADPKARRRVHGLSEFLIIFAILRVSVKRLPHFVILFINLRVLTVYWDLLSFTL